MWREYSLAYVKNNRSSSFSVMTAAFISALFLSLLCGLMFNAWKYEVERIQQEEGGWHSRLMGEFAGEEIEAIKDSANVEDVVPNEKEAAVDLYFDRMGAVLSDTPRIAEQMGIPPEKIVYHYELLAMYLIRDAGDTAPRLVFPMFLLLTWMASFSLIVIIHHAFAVSMNARIRQFGILSSIGATPKQIRTCLLQEAAALSALPVIAGHLSGIAGCMAVLHMVNVLLGSSIPGRHPSVFGYHPLVLLLTLFITVLTIGISAWLPARKLCRLTPLEAIRNTGELQLKRRKDPYLLTWLFGVEGELAGTALRAQRKALRAASVSLVFSFLAFSLMQCFFTLSGISTRETYFERYQDVWDVMITVRDAEADTFEETEKIQSLAGVEHAIVYQKAVAERIITEEEMSEEMRAAGGFSHASGSSAVQANGGWLVRAPIIILDDKSFQAYCEQIGTAPGLDGAVIFNQIRDMTNPDFRHPDLMPYIKEEHTASVLRQSGKEEMTAEIPVLAYTEKVPPLREEYAALDPYELVHFLPASLWKEIKGQIGGTEEDSYICIRSREHASVEELDLLQGRIEQLIGETYLIECENRIREYEINHRQIQGMMAVFGGFCILLAVIGISNVFSNTLGFARQRRREFARYLSVGLTPGGLKKMFCIEALLTAGRPILFSLPIVILAVGTMLRMSYLEAGVFMAEAPFVPILLFMLAVLGAVALAYALAWRKVRRICLAEVLRDDTMM